SQVDRTGDLLDLGCGEFSATLAETHEVPRGNPIRPRRELTVAPELGEMGGDLHEDLLARVLGVVRMPEHPQRQAVDLAFQRETQPPPRLPLSAHSQRR